MDRVRSRRCELNNHDLREHVDWMTRYADEAWRTLERKVDKMQPLFKAMNASEANFKAFEELLRVHKNNQVDIAQLKRNVYQLTDQHSKLHEDFKSVKMNAHIVEKNMNLTNETQRSNVEEIKNNYATIYDDVKELKDKFYVNREANRLNILASSEDIKQFKGTINHKMREIYNNLNGIREKHQQEVEGLKKFINEQINQCKEDARKGMMDNLRSIDDRMGTTEIHQYMAQINKNAYIHTEEIKINNDKIDNNTTKIIRSEINLIHEKCENLKNDLSNIKNQQDRLEKSIILKPNKIQTNLEIKKLAEKIKKDREEQKSARETLKERINLRIQSGAEVIEVLNNKVAEVEQKMEEMEEELKEIKKERENILKKQVKEFQRNGEYEKFVDMTTPHLSRFLIQANNITLHKQSDKWYQIKLRTVLGRAKPFILYTRINTTKDGWITIGVVDRTTQKQPQYSFNPDNAVCYYGCYGHIYYGNNGKHNTTSTGVGLKEGAELRVEVDLNRGMATFTLAGRKFTQYSDILCQHDREFVPYFQMWSKGDSVRWNIE